MLRQPVYPPNRTAIMLWVLIESPRLSRGIILESRHWFESILPEDDLLETFYEYATYKYAVQSGEIITSLQWEVL